MADGAGLLAGALVPSVQVRILPDCWGRSLGPWSVADFDANVLPARAPGEIVVTGAHVLRGYLDGTGDAAAAERRLLERLAWAHIAEVAIVPRIPLDARHNAKID